MSIVDTDCLVITSDEHVNSRLGLCHPDGFITDEGNPVLPSSLQSDVWEHWTEFWDEWVPRATDGQKYVWVNNGDAIEGTGKKHGNTDIMSQNEEDQEGHGVRIFEPLGKRKECKGVLWIRGTEAHGGKSGHNEEALAKALRSAGVPIIPTEQGNASHWEVFKRLGSKKGKGGCLVHCLHHIGTTGSQHYESTAPMKEWTEAATEAARWHDEPLAVVVRSHRHRSLQVRVPATIANLPFSQEGIVLITPGWQLKTPLVFRKAGARLSQPQMGGAIVRIHKGVLYSTFYVKRLARPPEV